MIEPLKGAVKAEIKAVKGDRLLFSGVSGHGWLACGYAKDITRANIGCCKSHRQSRQWAGDGVSLAGR
jgi:hypothetical protein